MNETRPALLERLQAQALQIRRNIWRSVRAGGSGHVGGSSSAADILAALYFYRMNIRPKEPKWPDRDRFVLSKGHANAALGPVLAQAGFIDDTVLDRFYGYESPFGMHPDIKLPGVEMCTGALGHGLAIAMGMALGARIQKKTFQAYVMIGDGELHEGSNWEAAMSASHYRLANLTAIIDANKISQSGRVADIVGVEPLADKWRAFGWAVREIDGHDMGQIVDALDALPFDPQRPSALIANTIKGKGVSFAENTYLWHSNNVTDEIYAKAMAELGAMTTAAASDWRAKSANQTRLAFGQALLELGAREPRTVVLSADTQDLLGIRGYIERYADRFVEVGIAEQNAIGIASGLATTGLRPYVCGYAPFITARSMEQLRNDVAYANQRVVIGAAASGISLGVAGGTHHALEDLALMRSFPNMTVVVPADVDEAYKAALATHDIDGPVYMRLGGRVEEPPVTDPAAPFKLGKATQLRAGNDVAVIACGCMVEMAVRASDALKQEGISARVLNMHTIKPFDRDAVLAAAAETRGIVTAEEHHLTGGLGGAVAELLALERPTRMRMVGMPDMFAMVGPTVKVRAKYGMSADAVAAACREVLSAK